MPYREIAKISQQKRADLAERRWKAIVEARPDLAPAIDLQRRLLTLVSELAEAFETGRLPRLSLPPRYLAAKLARGVPALAGEPIPLPTAALQRALIAFCDALAAGGAGEVATHFAQAIEAGRLDAASLFTASMGRDQ